MMMLFDRLFFVMLIWGAVGNIMALLGCLACIITHHASPSRISRRYEIKVYLFACWKLYSILRTFIPGPKNLFALFSFFAATMAWSGFGPYHGMWRE
jgi:hypothetical protein